MSTSSSLSVRLVSSDCALSTNLRMCTVAPRRRHHGGEYIPGQHADRRHLAQGRALWRPVRRHRNSSLRYGIRAAKCGTRRGSAAPPHRRREKAAGHSSSSSSNSNSSSPHNKKAPMQATVASPMTCLIDAQQQRRGVRKGTQRRTTVTRRKMNQTGTHRHHRLTSLVDRISMH